ARERRIDRRPAGVSEAGDYRLRRGPPAAAGTPPRPPDGPRPPLPARPQPLEQIDDVVRQRLRTCEPFSKQVRARERQVLGCRPCPGQLPRRPLGFSRDEETPVIRRASPAGPARPGSPPQDLRF